MVWIVIGKPAKTTARRLRLPQAGVMFSIYAHSVTSDCSRQAFDPGGQPERVKNYRRSYIPFGAGVHMCRQSFALMESSASWPAALQRCEL